MKKLMGTVALLYSGLTLAVPGSGPQLDWGIAIGVRYADIPYATEVDQVADIVPLMFFHGDEFYLHGLEAGYHLWQQDQHQATLFTRFRFFDIPREFQNDIQEDSFDLGGRYRYIPQPGHFIDTELLSDSHGRSYGHLRYGFDHQYGSFTFQPRMQLDWRSREFVEHYYALGTGGGRSDIGISAGVDLSWHLISNLYFIGKLEGSMLGEGAGDLPTLDKRFTLESYAGIAFFPEPDSNGLHFSRDQFKGHYLRVAHGWATPSNLGEILGFDWEEDPYNNQLTSVFYGIPLTDTLFGLPIDLYFTPGAVYHHSSEVQKTSYEGVVAIKAYYTIDWPLRWRFGVAEGLSYVSRPTYIERSDLEEKGYRPSKLMNYLDFSFDLNLGDLFQSAALEQVWFGWSIHHRSSIFESSSAFGRIKGGSNYNTLYLQWHF
ncbi:MipA/OmpV family protein [Ferrimonas futtsuensis]|uniref:MipA/OmpV family protein n=1 Tax=Ferrimonas futtsuensis TaxID=364764 RepID=UPI0003F529EB|nr:MipA/OmpV family protein [Ferrimonas futtsuensis]